MTDPRTSDQKTCHWSQDGEESDVWQTSCGHYFCITDGLPSENDMKFCCYCGTKLEESVHEFEVDEE
jgi:hypothetical protein